MPLGVVVVDRPALSFVGTERSTCPNFVAKWIIFYETLLTPKIDYSILSTLTVYLKEIGIINLLVKRIISNFEFLTFGF